MIFVDWLPVSHCPVRQRALRGLVRTYVWKFHQSAVRTLGLAILPSILARADEVIERVANVRFGSLANCRARRQRSALPLNADIPDL